VENKMTMIKVNYMSYDMHTKEYTTHEKTNWINLALASEIQRIDEVEHGYRVFLSGHSSVVNSAELTGYLKGPWL